MELKKIYLTTGSGQAPTKLAAFDAALLDAGIADHNLIVLSSVIPPQHTVVRQKYRSSVDTFGDRMYLVMATEFAIEPNSEAWAGLSWSQMEEDSRGLFVEAHGHNHQQVKEDLSKSIETLILNRGAKYGEIHSEIKGCRNEGQPACAIVAAVYSVEQW